jgi:hypothetical protein
MPRYSRTLALWLPWLVGLWLFSTAALAADAPRPALRVFGVRVRELRLDLAALRTMPRATVRGREHDAAESAFEGVALSSILERAGAPLGDQLRGPALRIGVLVHGDDGYRALFSLAELDPRMNPREGARRPQGRL